VNTIEEMTWPISAVLVEINPVLDEFAVEPRHQQGGQMSTAIGMKRLEAI
jgi:hypothetical protein